MKNDKILLFVPFSLFAILISIGVDANVDTRFFTQFFNWNTLNIVKQYLAFTHLFIEI